MTPGPDSFSGALYLDAARREALRRNPSCPGDTDEVIDLADEAFILQSFEVIPEARQAHRFEAEARSLLVEGAVKLALRRCPPALSMGHVGVDTEHLITTKVAAWIGFQIVFDALLSGQQDLIVTPLG